MRTGWWVLASILAVAFPGAGRAQAQPEATVAGPKTCDINIDNWNGTYSDRTYVAPYYESILTIAVRVNPVTCTWRIDHSDAPGWIRTDIISGASAGNGYRRGPGVVDIKLSKNKGYARGGRLRFVSSSYSVPVDIDQFNAIGSCAYQLKGTTPGEWTAVPPAFLVVRQAMSMPSNNFLSRITDASNCYINPRAQAYTFGMTGAKIQQMTGVTPRTFVLTRPGVARNTTGEGALFVLSDPTPLKLSGVLALDLPMLAALPPDQQVTQSFDKTFISFADGGGVVRIDGKVHRSMTPSPTRPCLFAPAYYTVMAPTSSGPWLSVTSESSCKSDIDHGTLVIAAKPNGPYDRVGVIFTPWGSVIFVSQPAG